MTSNVLLLPNRPNSFGGNGYFVLPTTGAYAASMPIGRLGRRPPAGRPEPATVLLYDVGISQARRTRRPLHAYRLSSAVHPHRSLCSFCFGSPQG
jgi:hypothetical protein